MAWLVAAPLAVPVQETSPFHFPGWEDFRFQHIVRGGSEEGWPFRVDEGWLMCGWILGTKAVYFSEMPAEGDPLPSMLLISTDPLEVFIGAVSSGGLLVKVSGPAEMIALLAPFQRLGDALCDQPRGTVIGPGEL